MGQFYENFMDNFLEYQNQNAEVVDTLFDFVDFAKFKATMLEFKKGEVVQEGDQGKNGDLLDMGAETFWKIQKEDVTGADSAWLLKTQVEEAEWTVKSYAKP